jgi:hypothetical protein
VSAMFFAVEQTELQRTWHQRQTDAKQALLFTVNTVALCVLFRIYVQTSHLSSKVLECYYLQEIISARMSAHVCLESNTI